MKILHLTPYYAPAFPFGGVVRAAEGMARALARAGHSVTVLTTDALSRSERYTGPMDSTLDGVRVVRAANVSLKLRAGYNLSTPIAMRRLAPDLVAWADVIHVHEFRTAENLIVTPLADRLHKPLILSPHGTLSLSAGEAGLKRIWDRLISPAVARRFSAVIGLTETETAESRTFWQSFGARAEFFTLANGVDPEEFAADQLTGGDAFRAQYGIAPADPVVLYLGRLHARKGIDRLVSAFKRLSVPGARLVIAGPDEGMLDDLRAEADNTPAIILTGYLDAAARKAALAAADVFVLPAIAGEGLPMAALEALAAGVPSILSPACGLDAAGESDAARIVPPEPDALAAALTVLLTHPDQRRTMSENARRFIRVRYTWDSVAAQLTSLYEIALHHLIP